MKVLMVNGSSNVHGCTYTALSEIGKALEENGIEYEIFQLGNAPIRDCCGCNQCKGNGCIFKENHIDEFIEKAKLSDGFIFGSPVYYAHPSGRLLSFLDRVFYSSSKYLTGKPASAIVSARRGGTTASIDVINKYFTINSMPVVSSTYWNMVHGKTPDDVKQDLEGLQTMRNIGKNMAWLLKSINVSKENGVDTIPLERSFQTNFIR